VDFQNFNHFPWAARPREVPFHAKFGPVRFCRFDVYWIQRDRSSLIISSASLLIEERACAMVQHHDFISSASCGIFIDLFLKQRSNKESFNNIVHHNAITRGQYGFIFKK